MGPDRTSLNFDALRCELRLARARQCEFVLFGSAVMYLHGLREQIGDIDLFVGRPLYSALRTSGRWDVCTPRIADPEFLETDCGVGVPVHAFHAWQRRDPMVDVGACFRYVEVVESWPCIPLWLVRVHKLQALDIVRGMGFDGREVLGSRWGKHVHDVEAIDRALAA